MAEKIKWESDFNQALDRAANEQRPIVLDFFNPG